MSENFNFKVPNIESDASTFKPFTHLPDHLKELARAAMNLRNAMDPTLRKVLECTDEMALRASLLAENR